MDKFYIALSPQAESTAWYKSIVDIEFFLNSMGYKPIPVMDCINNMENNLLILPTEEKCIVFVQFPRTSFEGLNLYTFSSYIKNHYKNVKLVGLVHDLDSVRYGDYLSSRLLIEKNELNLFDYLISINDSMTILMKEGGVTPPIFPLKIFDYIVKDVQPSPVEYNKNSIKIAYAGNLRYLKSPFIYQLDKLNFDNIKIMLYGPNLQQELFKSTKGNVYYLGMFSSDELAKYLNADYGLCWDGDDLESCTGKIGEYLKYTNPHKTSFYLSMGLPVIMCESASTSELIKNENVGIILKSLNDLPEALNKISQDEYKLLKENAIKISEKLKNGYFLKSVMKEIEDLI